MAELMTGIEEAASYGISEALLNDPIYGAEIKGVYELFKAGNKPAALDTLYKTSYYKELSSTVRARRKESMEQPAVYADNLDKFAIDTRRRLTKAGVKINESTLQKIIEDGYAKGMDADQIDMAISASGKITGFGGAVAGDTTALKAYAEQFGVANLLNSDYWQSKQQALFDEAITAEDIQKEIQQLSAGAYPAYADTIMTGTPVKSQLSNVIQSVSTYLERPADLNDPMVKKIAQWVDPATGKPGKMPQWMIEKTVKSDPSWAYTNNGRDTIDNITLKVAKDWGMM